jgi:hypothetical protein
MRSYYLLLLGLLLWHHGRAQTDELQWGTVPSADLLMSAFPDDPQAEAVILGERGTFYFRNNEENYEYQLNIYRRVKLLHKNAFDSQARVRIPFYHFADNERVLDIAAHTITPDGQVHPLSRREMYVEKKDEYWSSVNFTFPKLREGVVIEYRYTIISKDILHPRTWYFQHEVPVRSSELQLHNSSYLSFITQIEGEEYMDLVQQNKEETVLTRDEMRFSFSDKAYRLDRAPAIRAEAFMTNINDYRLRLQLQLSEITRQDGSKKPFLTSWEQSAEDLMNSPLFGRRFLLKSAYRKLDRILMDQVELNGEPEENMRAIYWFLLRRVQWNGRNGIQADRKLYDAFKTGKASAAELNLMLLALLNAHDIRAQPVLLSTRDHGRMQTQYPMMSQFNYVMALVSISGRTWLLDATDPLRPPGMPGINTLNKKAWVLNPDWPQWINLLVPPCRDVYSADLHIRSDGSISGVMQVRYSSYSAWYERRLLEDKPDGEYWLPRLQGLHPEIQIVSIEHQNIRDLNADLAGRIQFNLPKNEKSGEDFLFLPALIYSNFSENPFRKEHRDFPVDFPYPFEEKWHLTLHLPPTFEVVRLPESTNITLPRDQAQFSYEYQQHNNIIELNSTLQINSDLISPVDYLALKNLFDHYVQLNNASIVLKKR